MGGPGVARGGSAAPPTPGTGGEACAELTAAQGAAPAFLGKFK